MYTKDKKGQNFENVREEKRRNRKNIWDSADDRHVCIISKTSTEILKHLKKKQKKRNNRKNIPKHWSQEIILFRIIKAKIVFVETLAYY